MGELVRRTARLAAVVCQGLDDGTGERCGATHTGRPGPAGVDHDLVYSARAAGWRIGALVDGTPDAMCPRCAKPDPALVRLCRELGQR